MSRGFTLIEVMIALAILGLSLTVLLNGNINAISSSARVDGMTQATLLARSKMKDLERKLLKDGFKADEEDDEGAFDDEEHPEIKWRARILPVKLQTEKLTELAQQLMGGGQQEGGGQENSAKGGGKGAAMPTNPLGGAGDPMAMLAPVITPIAQSVGDNLRLVQLTVSWPEGKQRGSFEINAIVTSKALQQSNAAANPQVQGVVAPNGQVMQTAPQSSGTGQTGGNAGTP